MKKKSEQKCFNIKDFYYGTVCTISEPYEKYCEELKINTLFHNNGPKEYTLLLNQEGKWLDLFHPERRFYIERDGKDKSYVVDSNFPLEKYCKALGIFTTDFTIEQVCQIVLNNFVFFAYYTGVLIEQQELYRSMDGKILARKNSITQE